MGIWKTKPPCGAFTSVLFMEAMYQYLRKPHIKISKEFRGLPIGGNVNFG
jgi:hypothetical protein